MKWAAVVIKTEISRIWEEGHGFNYTTEPEEFPIGTSVIAHDNDPSYATVRVTVNDKGPYCFWHVNLEFLSPLEE